MDVPLFFVPCTGAINRQHRQHYKKCSVSLSHIRPVPILFTPSLIFIAMTLSGLLQPLPRFRNYYQVNEHSKLASHAKNMKMGNAWKSREWRWKKLTHKHLVFRESPILPILRAYHSSSCFEHTHCGPRTTKIMGL